MRLTCTQRMNIKNRVVFCYSSLLFAVVVVGGRFIRKFFLTIANVALVHRGGVAVLTGLNSPYARYTGVRGLFVPLWRFVVSLLFALVVGGDALLSLYKS